MSGMTTAFKNGLCADYAARIDGVSLHSDDPGTTGAHQIGSAVALTWGTPSAGSVSVTATFSNFVGDVAYVGLWDGAVFCDSREFEAHCGAPATFQVTLRLTPRERVVVW